MIPEQEIQKLIITYNRLALQYTAVLQNMTDAEINTAPAAGSWTAGQVVQHILKAHRADVFNKPGEKANRNIGEKIPELQSLFMNFDIKIQSPAFIVPEAQHYDKMALIKSIQATFVALAEKLPQTKLDEIIKITMGEITKWELANFIVMHAQRHLHQLENIYFVLNKKQ
jgi:hypothetical protein